MPEQTTPQPTVALEPAGEDRPLPSEQPTEELILEDLLVEDVSIDGMCGVY